MGGFRFIAEVGAVGSYIGGCPNGAQDSAQGDEPWVFVWKTRQAA